MNIICFKPAKHFSVNSSLSSKLLKKLGKKKTFIFLLSKKNFNGLLYTLVC